ncbi:endonuclease/exonuclease/phosphatase family protein [Arcanobacterium ihumii]|uniref:endonuclease/exonuclease/phosphatase family protein n=1 Tax=Arcanobacterium ihumii TaxID=2138162 RepID=UPI000F51D613|nr:endonuclease/exonuclease/phosphatase family protein [Arcanobacterium ihumii]
MGIILGIISLVFVGIALLTLKPDLFPYGQDLMLTQPFAQILGIRPLLAVGLVLLGVVLLILTAVFRGFLRRFWFTRLCAVVLIVIGFIHAGTIYQRGLGDQTELSQDPGITETQQGNGTVTILSYNTLGGATSPEQLAKVIVDNGVDVVTLPETSSKRGEQLKELLKRQGLKFQIFTTGTPKWNSEFSSTILLISESLGKYSKSPIQIPGADKLSVVAAVPASGHGPKIIATHPIAPVPRFMEVWRQEIAGVYGLCQSEQNFILAGDFNSTVDHQKALGIHCTDAALEADAGAQGTWPASLPAFLSAPIDRVLHDGKTYHGVEAITVEVGGSDHRGILVRLAQQ